MSVSAPTSVWLPRSTAARQGARARGRAGPRQDHQRRAGRDGARRGRHPRADRDRARTHLSLAPGLHEALPARREAPFVIRRLRTPYSVCILRTAYAVGRKLEDTGMSVRHGLLALLPSSRATATSCGGVRGADRSDLAAERRAGLHDPGPAGAGRLRQRQRRRATPASSTTRSPRSGGPRSPPGSPRRCAGRTAPATSSPSSWRSPSAARTSTCGRSCRPSAATACARCRTTPGSRSQAATGDLAWLLVLDAMVFQTEAEVRWLDHCESRLLQARRPPAAVTDSAHAADVAGRGHPMSVLRADRTSCARTAAASPLVHALEGVA